MRRVAIAIVLLAARVEAGPACGDFDGAEKVRAVVKAANEDHYRAAVKKLGLTAVEPELIDWEDDGTAYKYGNAEDDRQSVIRHDGKRVLAMGDFEAGCGGGPSEEFVKTGGKLYRVERDPQPGKAHEYAMCDCDGRALGCGINGGRRAFGYVIPKGLVYAGVKQVPFVADTVRITYGAGRKKRCSPPGHAK